MDESGPQWIRLEPERESDGTRYAWKLVIAFDADWQDWSVGKDEFGATTFTLHVPDDWVAGLNIPKDEA
jgi:hypothetical protein